MGIGEDVGQNVGENTGTLGIPLHIYADGDDPDAPVSWAATIAAASGTTTVVSNPTEFNDAAGSASPGDVILIADGTYGWSSVGISSAGTSGDPIIITAQNEGGVIFQDVTELFTVTGSFNLVGGFAINCGNGRDIFEFLGATDNRVTDNVINNPGLSPPAATPWLDISQRSHRTRFDHNTVNECSGPLRLLLNNDAVTNGPSLDCRIDHNSFIGSPYGPVAIMQVGQGDPSYPGSEALSPRLIFEHNFIDDIVGTSVAPIQVKSGYNVIRYNEIKDSVGGMDNRSGVGNEWYGNLVHGIGNGISMRCNGSYNKMYNNIIDCPDKLGFLMSRTGLRPNGTDLKPTHHNLIAFNTIFDYGIHSTTLQGGMVIGIVTDLGTEDPIHDCDIVNNIIIGSVSRCIRYERDDYDSFTGMVDNYNINIDNNLYYVTGTAVKFYGDASDANSIDGNPFLSNYAPTASSTLVIDAAAAIAGELVTVDYNGNSRPGGTNNDVGAVEY